MKDDNLLLTCYNIYNSKYKVTFDEFLDICENETDDVKNAEIDDIWRKASAICQIK